MHYQTLYYRAWRLSFSLLLIFLTSCQPETIPLLELPPQTRIGLIGNNLCARMMHFGYFEAELHRRYPAHQLFIRNLCDGGNTPGFRPHSGRLSPWAFPSAVQYQTEYANPSGSVGHFATPDEWLTKLRMDYIIAAFGYSESFLGEAGLERFRGELRDFILHTQKQQYNGQSAPKIVLLS
ncbi:MAG: dehydrogenase, partial [Bacteroidota bacterium]